METTTATASEPITPEIVKEETAVELSKPSIPVTVNELAQLSNDAGINVVKNREKIVDGLRRASIALTSPQDWLLFRAENRVTAYLQDSGCSRITGIWGITIHPIGEAEKLMVDDDSDVYAMQTMADGYCETTKESVFGITGVRYSDEDFLRDLKGIKRKTRVIQASIANRNGNIIRRLAGLQNVAIEFLEEVWKNTGKSTSLCPAGKGFGTRAEREGAGGTPKGTPSDVPAPICEICNKVMKFVSGEGKSYESFWSCPDKKKDPATGKYNNHSSIQDKQYREGLAKSKASEQKREPGAEG